MVEQVDKVEAELQIPLLPYPRQVVVLHQTRVHLHQSRIAVDVAPQGAIE
jgi:hypothetical protein